MRAATLTVVFTREEGESDGFGVVDGRCFLGDPPGSEMGLSGFTEYSLVLCISMKK